MHKLKPQNRYMTINSQQIPVSAVDVFSAAPNYRHLIRFTLPIVISLLTSALTSLVDTLFIGRLGTAQLAAVPVSMGVYIVGWLLLVGLMRNSVAFTGQALSKGQSEKVGWMLAHYHVFALLGLPLLLGAAALWPMFADLAQLAPEVAVHGGTYLSIRVWDTPFSLLLILYSVFYTASGNTRFPMQVALIVLLLNVVLDYGLIFGKLGMPRMEVAGSAWATVIAQAVGAAIIMGVAFASSLRKRFALRLWTKPDRALTANILRVGVPQGIGDSIEMLTWLSLTLIIGRLGTEALAASNIGMQSTQVLFLPGLAIGIAASTYMARLKGYGLADEAAIAVRRCLQMAALCMGTLGIPLWFFGETLAGFFTSDPQVIKLAAITFKVMAVYQIVDACGIVLRAALGGAGDTFIPSLMLAACAALLMIPGALWLSTVIEPGLLGAWMGALVYMVALAAAMWWRFHSRRWETLPIMRGA